MNDLKRFKSLHYTHNKIAEELEKLGHGEVSKGAVDNYVFRHGLGSKRNVWSQRPGVSSLDLQYFIYLYSSRILITGH